jgi:hypothetical protein
VTISIAQYLRLQDVFGGPLTDNELSESDGEMDDLSWLELGSDSEGSKLESMRQSPPKTHSEGPKSASVPPQSPQKTHSQKQKERKKHWTQKKHQATQEAARTSMKAVVKKRVLESCRIAVLSDYSTEKDASISSSGWIGLLSQGHKPAQDQDNPIRDQAKKKGLTYFPWDRR